MKLTKAQIDDLAALELKVEDLKKQLKDAETVYKKALAPVADYVNSQATPDQTMRLTGRTALIEFGVARAVRKLVNPVAALHKLEAVQPGLGYENISLPIRVLDEYLRPAETEGLYALEYGARAVKVTTLNRS